MNQASITLLQPRKVGTTIISTGYFTSGNEPHEIVNATHNTFTKKLDMKFKYIFSFFLEMLHFQFRRAQSLIKYPVYRVIQNERTTY
jgi:hypothetical protein